MSQGTGKEEMALWLWAISVKAEGLVFGCQYPCNKPGVFPHRLVTLVPRRMEIGELLRLGGCPLR